MNEKATAIQQPYFHSAEKPVIIIGTGPAGMRCAQEVLKRNKDAHIVIYGGEPWEPYDRVALSSVLSGDVDWSAIDANQIAASEHVIRHDNCPIVKIDPERKVVIDCEYNQQAYSKLIIATGSSPHVPVIKGIDKQGIYTFRDKSDVQQLMARRARSRTTVVLGGGLLGIEAARAMQRQNTEVIIIEHSTRLMYNQLDKSASSLLRERVLSNGIKTILGDGIKNIIGDNAVSGVQLHSGRIVHCDTIIVATGIRPNIGIARDARLKINKGIRVNDQMQTSDPNIYAVGECAEHRGKVYGIVAPGLEQSAVAAHSITGGLSSYKGSLNSTRLKVIGENVFSCGDPDTEQDRPALRLNYVYEEPGNYIYRKIVVENGRIIGVIALGEWTESSRIQDLVIKKTRIWPWHVSRFVRTGYLFNKESSEKVASWPAAAVVCSCKNINRGQLTDEIDKGCKTVTGLMECTGASTVCGSCRPLLSELVGDTVLDKSNNLTKPLLVASLLSLFAVLIYMLFTPVAYTQSTQYQFAYDLIWRDGLYKQISGFSLLGLTVILLLLPLRKRIKKFSFGSYVNWRMVHAALGIVLVITLFAHTGLRLGENLNFMLISCYLSILLLGGLAGASAHLETIIGPRLGKRIRTYTNKMHLYAFWPAPVLLGFHILSVYYF